MSVSDEDRELLKLHCPQLRYHPNELYRADSAATFTEAFTPAKHSNELRDGASQRVIAQVRPVVGTARLSLALLCPKEEPYFPGGPMAKEGDYLRGHADTLIDDWLAARALPGLADRVYCRAVEGKGGRRWLQYWMFFYDNPYKRFGMGEHQGDWELVEIAVVAGKPTLACYSQHGQSESRAWKDVETSAGKGIVPVAWVAKGSHALYFKADSHLRIFGLANDHTADGGVGLRPEPYFLDDHADRWIHWPGTWGPPGSPPGPPAQQPWDDPEGFHENERKRGPFAGLEQAAIPGEPELTIALDGDAVVVGYTIARRGPGRSDPVRLELALYGDAPQPVPSVVVIDVTEARGRTRVPLPYNVRGPYTLHAAVYDADDEELRLTPRTIGAGRSAGLEAAELRRPQPPRHEPLAPTALRLIVRAPAGDDDDRQVLAQAVTRTDELGPRFRVASLFAGDEPELRRFLTVAGTPFLAPGSDVAAATFEAARRLQLPEGWEVFADPPSVAGSPDPEARALGAALERDALDWVLRELHVHAAWELHPPSGGLAKGEGIVIGQPDTGYTDHPELELDALDRLRDYDVLSEPPREDGHAVLKGFPPFAFPSHGTGTASVAVSRGQGEITGSAPLARVIPIRAAASVIHIRNAELALAVEYALSQDVDVISISMGGVLYPPALEAVIKRAVDSGVIVLAAAGQFTGMVVWPARLTECLAVAGSGPGLKPWLFSAIGREVDISAPGEAVWCAQTRKSGADPYYTAQHDGTSFAVALTAGVAALWLAHHGGRDEVAEAVGGKENVQWAFRALARRTVTEIPGWDTEHRGPGIVNAEKLLQAELASWGESPDKPYATPTEPVARALDAAAALAPEGVAIDDAQRRVLALFDGDRAALERFGDEVAFRLGEHVEVRDAVLRPPSAGLEATLTGRAVLRALASPSLREAIGEG